MVANALPHQLHKIAGLLLAGGRSSRFAGNDKGLQLWRQKPLAEHVLQRLAAQVNSVTISCNRNLPRYEQLALRYARNPQALPLCIEDSVLEAYSGPLAGIFSLLEYVSQLRANAGTQQLELPNYLMVCCCDNPVLPFDIVSRLAQCLVANNAVAAYPLVGGQHARLTLLLQVDPATAAMQRLLAANKLAAGQGCSPNLSVKSWLAQLATATCELEDNNAGQNINRPADLAKLDSQRD